MIKLIDIKDKLQAEAALKLQKAAYQVEAELTNFEQIPPLQETLDQLQQSKETYYGYFQGDELCGFITCKWTRGVLDIHKLVTHPRHFKKGIAQALLVYVEKKMDGLEIITVSTGTRNEPAIRFYKKNGFEEISKQVITEQFSMTHFSKKVL
ncbi:GNAT family N-acetyltransferase [Alkalihalobacillus sp. 1P02AB]|uniref:GNAT family N-acetyltransferase n=1 Tax=Alkalihalobacillus sp. 1P02AB TaxID=3132260 RepID=UPI0039A4BD29